jgi:hypothetical protein
MNRWKLGFRYFMRIDISYILHWFGEGSLEYIHLGRSILRSIGYLDKTSITVFYKYGPEKHVRSSYQELLSFWTAMFVQEGQIEKMQHATRVSVMALRNLWDGFWQPCCNENLVCYLCGRWRIWLRKSWTCPVKGTSLSCPGWDLMWLQYSEFKIASLHIGQFA